MLAGGGTPSVALDADRAASSGARTDARRVAHSLPKRAVAAWPLRTLAGRGVCDDRVSAPGARGRAADAPGCAVERRRGEDGRPASPAGAPQRSRSPSTTGRRGGSRRYASLIIRACTAGATETEGEGHVHGNS